MRLMISGPKVEQEVGLTELAVQRSCGERYAAVPDSEPSVYPSRLGGLGKLNTNLSLPIPLCNTVLQHRKRQDQLSLPHCKNRSVLKRLRRSFVTQCHNRIDSRGASCGQPRR